MKNKKLELSDGVYFKEAGDEGGVELLRVRE